jgi:hypothetical protein
MSKISTVHLNDTAATQTTEPNQVAIDEPASAEVHEPASIEVPKPEAAAEDIDTDELESLLIDLKKTKKQNKAPSKPRVRKPKAKAVEEVPVVVEPVVPDPVVVEPVVDEAKTKRKYTRKPTKVPEVAPEALEPATPQHVEEPAKRPSNLIEEMQRAERALRYQMRKNKMQTLVSQAF